MAEALATHPAVEMVNVYGVEVPGADGRAGMAALVLGDSGEHDPTDVDGADLYAHVAATLPTYAIPMFVRVQDEADTTSTLKLRKVELKEAGWDPRPLRRPRLHPRR